jgi:uncharacterized protein DUF4150
MSVSIMVNNLTLCHKGDGVGTVTATVPDVCKTPPQSVPVPYPNIALSIDLVGGTTTVLVDGGNMAAHSASIFAKSTGDEPGTLGGVVSLVNMMEASWLSYSMDVFLEGLNACRLTDKMLLNHGNTVSMGGFLTTFLKAWVDAAKKGTVDCDALAEMIEKILNGNKDLGTGPTGDTRGVKERWFQQNNGKIAPGEPGWDTHDQQLDDMQKQLRDHLNTYEQWCGGGPPIPVDAWEWATKPRPNAKSYEGPEPESHFSMPPTPVIVAAVVVAGIIAIAVFPPAGLVLLLA